MQNDFLPVCGGVKPLMQHSHKGEYTDLIFKSVTNRFKVMCEVNRMIVNSVIHTYITGC